MTFFACVVRLDGAPVMFPLRARVDGCRWARDQRASWHAAPGFRGVTGLEPGSLQGRVARWGTAVAIGVARLDNRAELLRGVEPGDERVDDLSLALRLVARSGGAAVASFLGDFAFVAWDGATRKLLAARDTFGVRKLYWRAPAAGELAFASRAELLAEGEEYDAGWLAARVAYCHTEPDRTAFAGVRAVPPAGTLRVRNGAHEIGTYWNAFEAQAAGGSPRAPGEQIEAFRSLLVEGVRARLGDGAGTWSELSGGMDSSGVVSVAEWLAECGEVPRGLGGTVTYVDERGTGADEKEWSDAVVERYGVRNALVSHHVGRAEILRDPPALDLPLRSFVASAREQRTARVIRGAGGGVLLTGIGGDNLSLGTMFFFADWLVTGRAWEALREMAHRAALGRVSFWELAFRNALLPLLPGWARRAVMPRDEGGVMPWVPRDAARHYGLHARTSGSRTFGGRVGRKYADAVAETIAGIPATVPIGPLSDALDVRHPYLHRPLVELALRLPPELCVRPHARKWIVREAMRGILPELVRTRVGKGNGGGLVAWSLLHDRAWTERLLRDSILAQLGCLEPRALRAALEAIQKDPTGAEAHLKAGGAIEIELWLQLRAGRWAAALAHERGDAGVVAATT